VAGVIDPVAVVIGRVAAVIGRVAAVIGRAGVLIAAVATAGTEAAAAVGIADRQAEIGRGGQPFLIVARQAAGL
jgi:hypothetical protein